MARLGSENLIGLFERLRGSFEPAANVRRTEGETNRGASRWHPGEVIVSFRAGMQGRGSENGDEEVLGALPMLAETPVRCAGV